MNVPVEWLKDGKPIKMTKRYHVIDEGYKHRFVIKDIGPEDVGLYSITVKGQTSKGKLAVEAPPQLHLDERFKDSITLKTNTSAIIEVPFTGSPLPEVSWRFNGGKFSDSRRIKEETIRGMTSLTISRADRKDSGDYNFEIL